MASQACGVACDWRCYRPDDGCDCYSARCRRAV